MTFAQLEQLWISQGGNPSMAPIMAAIALAESSGDPNNTTGDNGTSYGLWQIHWTVHPQFNPTELTNPAYNAQAAIQLSGNGQNLSPWTTWESYLAGSGHGYDVISKILGPSAGSSLGSASSPASSSSSSTAPASSSSSSPSWLQNLGNIPVIGGGLEGATSAAVVGGFAIVLLLIGGIWLIFGNESTRTIVVNTGKAAKAAAIDAAV